MIGVGSSISNPWRLQPDATEDRSHHRRLYGHFFQLPVRVRDGLPLSPPQVARRRVHPQGGVPQILTTYVRDELLKPQLPGDAVALSPSLPPISGLARGGTSFSASDRWPTESACGRFAASATPKPAKTLSASPFRRTLGTATHETGHMFYVTLHLLRVLDVR